MEYGTSLDRTFQIGFFFLENVVDGGQQYSGNGNDGFLASTTPFECKVTISDFRELLGADGTKSALNK